METLIKLNQQYWLSFLLFTVIKNKFSVLDVSPVNEINDGMPSFISNSFGGLLRE
ncbi:MAG TPA: hypothetical protein VM884_01410 [Flavisolibacter sp.]|jgi:hypothetical protein|nr:hypothetical protein [Flavisolibacter sp.]